MVSTEKRPFRVLTGELHHETNTFSVIPTTIDNFRAEFYWSTASDIIRERVGTKTLYGATFEAAEKFGWSLETTISASANPSGLVDDATFELLAEQLIGKATASPELLQSSEECTSCFDGILLHLHGAMVSCKYEDCEGEILQRLRNKIGTTVPVIVTLDLHGNITQKMVDNCTLLLAVRTYPHIDFYETAQRAAELLQQTMLQQLQPVTVLSRRHSMLRGLDGGKTQPGTPLRELIDKYNAVEAAGDCICVSICAGFLASDIYDIGPSVTVTTDARRFETAAAATAAAARIADEAMDFIWQTRHFAVDEPYSVAEVIDIAVDYQQRVYSAAVADGRPLVIAEVTDNPGSGHYGDATNLLKGIIMHNINCQSHQPQQKQQQQQLTDVVFYAIIDGATVLAGEQLGVGNMGSITLGGKWDPHCGGGPLQLHGKVVALTDGCFQTFGPMGFGGMWQNYGKSMLFRVDHIIEEDDSIVTTADSSNVATTITTTATATTTDAVEGASAGITAMSITRCNVDVIVITNSGQIYDTAQITSLGCDLPHKKTIVVKSKHHFRACIEPLAGRIVCADGGGLGSTLLSKRPTTTITTKVTTTAATAATTEVTASLYRNVRRPIWPLDGDDEATYL